MQPKSRADGHDTLIDDNRAYGRDTFIYDSNHRDTLLGGLRIAEGTTNTKLYYMVEIICVFTGTFDLHDDNEQGRYSYRGRGTSGPGKSYLEWHSRA